MMLGEVVRMRGVFTKAHWLRGVTSTEVEQRVGFRLGRLADGWWLCFMTEMPLPQDFEFLGYGTASGVAEQGHLPNPLDPGSAEQRLLDDCFDLGRLKSQAIDEIFALSGPDRLAKVIPAAEDSGEPDGPAGKGVEQWTLVRDKPFRVAAFLPRGAIYDGNYI